jgi:dGTPase
MRAMAPWAADPGKSRGRAVAEPESPPRSPYQRDRDRVIHSTAFRRLKHKTQVFVAHEGDHYRTRLTHSLEVAQVARSIARALGLDEDLTEALSLAHDLGHTPFGHAGEAELDRLMTGYGGFDHNAQGLRIVTRLERRYAAFDGLNLTMESLEGLIKHNGPLVSPEGRPLRRDGRPLPETITDLARAHGIDLSTCASAEAQVAAIADDIAYNAHDIDDGLRAQLFDVIDLGDVPLAGEALSDVLRTWPKLDQTRLVHETVRRVMSAMINDVIAETKRQVKGARVATAADVTARAEPVVMFSAQMRENNRVLQTFLSRRMYRHERVMETMGRARRLVRDLFEAYMADERLIAGEGPSASGHARRVCDYIAGMTDSYAIEQHRRLFDLDPLFR